MKTDNLEAGLESMFAAQAEALAVPAAEPFLPAPAPAPSRRHRPVVRLAAVAAVLAAVTVAALALRPAPGQRVVTDGTAAGGPEPAAGPFRAETPQVLLTARALLIDVAGKRFTGAGAVDVSGDPGTWDEYTTLELTWREHEVEMRLYAYFKSDGRQWWSDEIRTYDGAEQGEWITHTGDFFRSPLGRPFVGDLDLRASDHGRSGRLRLPGLHLEVFRRPAACVTKAAPQVIVPGAEQLTLRAGPGQVHGLRATVFDTATCNPLAGVSDGDLVWLAEDPSVVEVGPGIGGNGVELRPKAVGTTVVRVTSTLHLRTAQEGRVTVTVLPAEPSGPPPVDVPAGGPPPTP